VLAKVALALYLCNVTAYFYFFVQVKVCDFGLAAFIKQGKENLTRCSTMNYSKYNIIYIFIPGILTLCE
jgi:hypothetical protein